MTVAADGIMTTKYADLGTDPVPTDMYWRPEWYEKEIEAIFRRTWLHIASAHEIPNVGDFVVKDVPPLRHKVIVVRGKDEKIRVFQNVCTHRGSDVELSDKGNCKRFTCPFHAWSFSTEGKLIGVPSVENFFDLERKNKGLIPVTSDVWEHHVFVNFAAQPIETLEDYLGEFGRDLRGWPGWEQCSVSWEYQAEVDINWKLLLDAFNETYHVPIIHRNSVRSAFSPPGHLNGEILGATWKYPHRCYSGPGNPGFKPKPGQLLGYANAPAKTLLSGGSASDEDKLPKGLNEGRHAGWAFDQSTFFPNWALVVTPQVYFSHKIWPISPNKSRWDVRLYSTQATTAAERFGQEYGNVELRDTLLEDANTFERIQRSLESGLVPEFTFQDHEICCRIQYNTVKAWVEDWEKSQLAAVS